MKILISPSKTLDFECVFPDNGTTMPIFQKEAVAINRLLRNKTPSQLSELMGISENISNLNWERNQNFPKDISPTDDSACPCIYCFRGDVYLGFDVQSFPEERLPHLQSCLRIISGLYGLLRPMDLIYPYRLEMGIKMKIETYETLADFWKDKVTNALKKELQERELLVNLLSKEYASAIDFKWLKTNVISPIFKDYKNGEYKVISFFAKRARGLMARYIVDQGIECDEDDLLAFKEEGYTYSESLTKNHHNPVFIR